MTDKPKSLYTHDGSFIEGTRKASTIQELVDLLNEYPRNLPLIYPVFLAWTNIGKSDTDEQESLVFIDEHSWIGGDEILCSGWNHYADDDEDEETSESSSSEPEHS